MVLIVISEGERSRIAWQKFFGEAEEGDLKDFASQALADLSYRLTEARVLGREMGLAAKQLNPSPVGEGKPPERPERESFDTPAPAM